MARTGAGLPQVALHEHGGHERDEQDAELRLDEGSERGERGGALTVAADEGGHAEEDDERPCGVALAPERRVVEGHRVEQVERGGSERHGLSSPPGRNPAQDEPVEGVADGQVDEHRRQLHEAHGHLAGIGAAAGQQPDGPEQVEVGGRIVGEPGVGVEAGRAVLPQRQGPRCVGGEVRLEARGGEEDVCDSQPQ